jgi:hypothetical protein
MSDNKSEERVPISKGYIPSPKPPSPLKDIPRPSPNSGHQPIRSEDAPPGKPPSKR